MAAQVVHHDLRTVFWNARGVRNKLTELIDFINNENIDIIGITESFLDANYNLPLISDYNVIRHDGTNHSGGLMLLIKSNISFSERDTPTTNLIDCIAVTIHSSRDFIVYVVYCPGGSTQLINSHLTADLQSICNNNQPYFIMGDFNAKHRGWNCTRRNRAGTLLFDFIESSNNYLSFPDSHTYSPVSTRMSPSTIDLLITCGRIPSSRPVTIEILSSDHIPVLFEIHSLTNSIVEESIFDYSNANWNMFQDDIHYSILPQLQFFATFPNPVKSTIDDMVETLTSAVLDSEATNVPKTRKTGKTINIPPHVKSLISARNHFRRRFTRYRHISDKISFQSLNKQIKLEISEIINKKFTSIIIDCNRDKNNIYKVIKNKRHVNLPSLKPESPGSRRITSAQGKADSLATSFANNHINPLNTNQITHTSLVNRTVKNYLLNGPTAAPPQISVQEVASYIKDLRVNKACGLDRINNRIVKKLPISAIHFLTLIFNYCAQICYFPDNWKVSKTIPIPKSSKDRTLITSYRPIALLNGFSKLFEKAIHSRLISEIANLNCLPHFQFGFRRGHSTTHALRYLTDFIHRSFAQRKTTAVFYFDVQKAFDTVWHNGLLYKIARLNFSSWLIRIIASFLRDRHFEVHVGNKVSQQHQVPYGVPQGSVLSPTLYSLYTHDIPVQISNVAMYADDTAIFAADRFIKRLLKGMLQSTRNIIRYYTKWKISLNAEKTIIMFHTKRKTKQLPPRSITINRIQIPVADSAKYLGIHLDNRLTMKSHIQKTILKTDNICRALYPFIKRRGFATKALKLKVYKTYLRSALLYATPILRLSSATTRTLLQRRQNKYLRMILNEPIWTKISLLHERCNLRTINEFIEKLQEKFESKCSVSDNPIIRELIQ